MANVPCTVFVLDRAAHARYVEDRGFEAVDAAGTLEALAALAERPDVALLFSDVLLSRMDGERVAEHLAGLGTRVIVLHGATDGVTKMDEALAEKLRRRRWLDALRRAMRAVWQRLTGGGGRRDARDRMEPSPAAAA